MKVGGTGRGTGSGAGRGAGRDGGTCLEAGDPHGGGFGEWGAAGGTFDCGSKCCGGGVRSKGGGTVDRVAGMPKVGGVTGGMTENDGGVGGGML